MKRLLSVLVLTTALVAPGTAAHADTVSTSGVTVSGGFDIYSPSVLVSGTRWDMWFAGWMTRADVPNDKIFHSVSEDGGRTWSTPTLAFQIQGIAVNDPSVVRVSDGAGGSRYLMYFTYANYDTDSKNLTGLATSSDGVTWTSKGVVIGYDNHRDKDGAWAPSAVPADATGSSVYLYYHTNGSANDEVYRSTMVNNGETLGDTVKVTAPDGVPRVNVDVSVDPQGTYWMFYNSAYGVPSTDKSNYNIEKMVSSDGLHWRPSRDNPVLRSDTQFAATPNVVWTGPTTYSMFYGLGDTLDATSSHRIYRQDYSVSPEPPAAFASRSASGDFAATHASDGDPGTSWSSENTGGSAGTPAAVGLDLGTTRTVHQVVLTARVVDGVSSAFPTDFSVQTSPDGLSWTPVPGQDYTDYADPGTAPQTLTFADPVDTRYVRVVATGFRADINGYYYFQLADLQLDAPAEQPGSANPVQSAAASSTALDATYPFAAVDGDASTSWSSGAIGGSSGPAQYLWIDAGSVVPVSRIDVTPREYGGAAYGFPEDFHFESSTDGSTWSTIPGQTHTGYAAPDTSVQSFSLDTPISARHVRMVGTRFRTDPNGAYVMQIAELHTAH